MVKRGILYMIIIRKGGVCGVGLKLIFLKKRKKKGKKKRGGGGLAFMILLLFDGWMDGWMDPFAERLDFLRFET